MISVKKPDGTTVRVPLSEFKKMHAPPAPAATPASAPVSTPRTSAPVKLDPHNEITAAPETSLLEETVSPAEMRSPEIMQTPPAITDEVVRQIVRDSKLMVANDLWGRAQSLVTSWLKGVRDNDQFTDYASAAPDKGGLGLAPEVAAGLLIVMMKYKKSSGENLPTKERPSVRPALEVPLSAPATKSFANSLGETKPLVANVPVAPVVVQPVAPVLAEAPPTSSQLPPQSPPPPVPLPPISPRVVQDIRTSAASILTGPAEEMQSFGINDWRRLGAQTEAAQTAFLAKFNGWRGESFLLYMDAVNAWQQSPLVRQYLEIGTRAINERQTIAQVAASTGYMSPAEWLAVNAVNREIML